jgi:hypothetical protein
MDSFTVIMDVLGRIKKITWANNSTLEYFYDACGNRTSVVTACPSGTC